MNTRERLRERRDSQSPQSRTRESAAAELRATVDRGHSVVLSAPVGSGRTTVLRQLDTELTAEGRPAHRIDCAHPRAAEQLRDAEPAAILLLDSFESAGAPLLNLAFAALEAGAVCVAAVDPSSRDSPLQRAVRADPRFAELPFGTGGFHLVDLPPLTAPEIEALVYRESSGTLGALTHEAIVHTAEGRPAWAHLLVRLALSRNLEAFPRARVIGHHFPGSARAALRRLRRQLGDVSRELATAAVALSEVEDTDVEAAASVVGADTTELLLRRGLLLHRDSPNLVHVPALCATALRDEADPAQLERYRSVLAERLLNLASLGVPLGEADALYVARRPVAAGADRTAPGGGLPDPPREGLRAAHARVIERCVRSAVMFRRNSLAQSLLATADARGGFTDPLIHAEILAASGHPAAARARLEAQRSADDDAHARLGADFLLAALSGEPHGESGPDVELAPFTTGRAAPDEVSAVLRCWNDAAVTPEATEELAHVAEHAAEPAARALAATLLRLEAVWGNRAAAARPPNERAARLDASIAAVLSDPRLRHVAAALLFAEALVALLSGDCDRRAGELHRLAQLSELRECHARWIAHFRSTAIALARGNLPRASTEWRRAIDTTSRFLPGRLQRYAQELAEQIDTARAGGERAAPTATAPLSSAAAVVRYLGGQHRDLAIDARRADGRIGSPVLRLGIQHVSALTAENPRELVRIAEHAEQLGLWGPAAFALNRAREIYLSRRTVARVAECNDRIARLERAVRARVPWHRRGDLPTSDYVRLTAREESAARLAARGLTNKQIAAELHCSVRTVESHLALARAKLGVASRRELADLRALRDE